LFAEAWLCFWKQNFGTVFCNLTPYSHAQGGIVIKHHIIPGSNCRSDPAMTRSPRSDRPLARLIVLALSCAATAIFYAVLISFFTGFDIGTIGFLVAAAIGAIGGLVLSAII
jgi:hypothetical protein